MQDRIEAWVAETLRRQAGHTLSLQRLHDGLVRELGASAGSYHQLQQRLKQARGAFYLQERAHPLLDDVYWPAEVREQYAHALRSAGLDVSPLVSLQSAPEDPEPGILGVLERTLSGLRATCQADQALAAEVANAFNDLPDLQAALEPKQPTTIVLRDLPPAH